VEALAGGGVDAVLRIGASGYRLPDDERLYNLHGDRVLTTRPGPDGGNTWMVVRDLEGNILHEFDTGMTVPQTGIVRGDDVYFGGVDLDEEDAFDSIDRGAWVVHGDGPPETLVAPTGSLAIYQEFHTSPDGSIVGVTRSEEEGAVTYFVEDGATTKLQENLLLITMTNEVAVLIGAFSDITAFDTEDGTELWHAEVEGFYGARYATSDGRIVNSVVEDAGDGDGNSQDQLRIEVLDARTGVATQTVLIPIETGPSPWITPTLSSDRYAALVNTVLPSVTDGPGTVRIVDLDAGELLDLELEFGEVP
jgi:hypothetical protein